MKKGFFTLSLAAISLVGIGAATVFSSPKSVKKAIAQSTETPSFDGEIQYTGEEVSISAISCSENDFSASYQISYSTGGNSIYDNAGGKFVYVLGYDTSEDGLIAYAEDFQKKDVEVQDEIQEKIAKGELSTVTYSGYIFQFNSVSENVFIPETISRGTYGYNSVYDVEIDAISEHAFKANSVVKKIYIPDTIATIPSSAFENASQLEEIYCEASSKPAGWEDGWNCGKTVHWGENIYSYAPTQREQKLFKNSQTTSLQKVGNDEYNYIFGYQPQDQSKGHYPLTVEYKLEGGDEVHWLEIEKSNEHGDYDSVGGQIGTGASSNLYSNSFYIDIDLQKGEVVDFDSIVIHNFFAAKSEIIDGVRVFFPDMNARYFASPAKVFSRVSYLSDYITTSFKRVSNFGGYTAITASVSKVKSGIEIYKIMKPYYYEMYKKNLASGKAFVRYRLTQLGKAEFRIDSGNGFHSVEPHTPISQYILKKNQNNNLGFVFKNSQLNDRSYNFKNIKSFAVKGMTLTIDIVNDGIIIKTTAARARFGAIYFKAPTDKIVTFDADLFLIIFAVAYTVLAFIISAALFLIYKKVFKNDEFRRLKPKQFIKKAIIYWLTTLALALTILFVVIRCTVFANAIVVYNPVDVFIVLFGIASIIIIGYFVKNLITAQKARNQRKKAIKLGMVNEVADDGTK